MVISHFSTPCPLTSENLAFYYKQEPSLLTCVFVYLPIITMDSSVSIFSIVYNSLFSLIIWYHIIPDFAGGNPFKQALGSSLHALVIFLSTSLRSSIH